METDIRWKQRFSNYCKAFSQLEEAINENGNNPPDIIKEGIIHRFEFTHELAWKMLNDFLEYEGYQNITGSRTAIKEAFRLGIITNGQTWMDMIESRNKTVHTYDEVILKSEFNKIYEHYFPLFSDLKTVMSKKI